MPASLLGQRSAPSTPWLKLWPLLLVLGAVLVTLGAPAGAAEPANTAAEAWVEQSLSAMTVEQKAAQLFMVRAFGQYQHPESAEAQDLLEWVGTAGVGGVVLFDSDLESISPLLESLQNAAALPLLVAADIERGLAFRVRRGTVPLPYAMAVGATRSPDAARFVGEVTAREALALGIHWAFAPVADVNNNPDNPVIHLRSFGEDAAVVAELTRAFIEGARSGGLLTTAKHFPGHGDTAVDSHFALPTLSGDRQRLEAIELLPFRAAVAAGVDSVMTGHIAVPALDTSGQPATLSQPLGDFLRQELAFSGLIVTDALEMGGIAGVWPGAAVVQALQAGADVLILPPDPRVAIDSLVRAVREGQLSEQRLETSVRRILRAKAALGLHVERHLRRNGQRSPRQGLSSQIARPEDMARAEQIARQAITVVRNEGDVLPLRVDRKPRLLHLNLSSRSHDRTVSNLVVEELRQRRLPVTSRWFGPELSQQTLDELGALAADASHVLVSSYHRVGEALSPSQLELFQRLQGVATPKIVPTIVLSFGDPYLLAQIPQVSAYLNAYGSTQASQRAAASALLGEFTLTGKLPVSLPGYPAGSGLELAEVDLTLKPQPETAPSMAAVDRLLEDFVEQGAFPGGVLAVGLAGQWMHLKPFGRLADLADVAADTDAADADAADVAAAGADAAKVNKDTIYDLASLTKVIATTTMAMMMVDEGRLSLDALVQDFLPRFQGAGKEQVTIRHLLTHTSGIDWWAPLYEELSGPAAYVERIQAMDLVYEPGGDTKYSDLGLILLGEILERVAGQSLDEFVEQRLFQPLGMSDTGFRPAAGLHSRIAPTELDPWRGRLLRGEVHDENAFALGGVAPHAGLFGTAPDLAVFAQMLLNGGVYDHQRLISASTVELFTRLAGITESTRALGWDTRSAEKSSAGEYLSMRSFGHTGFTGTSIWLDPERQLFIILLTNRVHPSRDNIQIRQARPAIADAVFRALFPQ